jgi:hypothetical protein
MARKVTAPDGLDWTVGRQWVPWRWRLWRERVDLDGPSGGDMGWAIDDVGGILVALGVLVVLALVFLAIWPLVAIAIEIVLIGIGLLATVAGRVVLRKPWTVRAVARGHEHTWKVRGWRASGERIDEVATALAGGFTLPETTERR